jgi:hypothetical protein
MGAKKPTRTLADFRAAHDPDVIYPARIKAALAEMLVEGAEIWEYEQDFLRRAGVSNNYISPYREAFADHIVETGGKQPKRVWFADPKVAKKVRS